MPITSTFIGEASQDSLNIVMPFARWSFNLSIFKNHTTLKTNLDGLSQLFLTKLVQQVELNLSRVHNTLESNGHLETSRKKFTCKEIGKGKLDLYLWL